MALNSKILSITAGSLLGLAFIFFVVANAVPAWSKYGTAGSGTTTGLWRTCLTITNLEQQCFSVECPPSEGDTGSFCSKILAARAFVTLACIMSGISTLLLFISVAISDNAKQISLMAAKGLAFACLVMGIIGVAVGINGTTAILETKLDWGASAIIGIIAIVLNLCGAIATVLIK